MSSVVGLVTFPTMDGAETFLKSIKKMQKDNLVTMRDHVVIIKDEEGHISVKDSSLLTKNERGAVKGGALGFVLGALIGGPIGAAALGTAAGYYATKKLKVGSGHDKIKSIAKDIENNSSALFVHINSHKEGLLKTAVRNAGGEIAEATFTDDDEAQIGGNSSTEFTARYDTIHYTA